MTNEERMRARFKPEYVKTLAEKMSTLTYSEFYKWYFDPNGGGNGVGGHIEKNLIKVPEYKTVKATRVLHMNYMQWMLSADVLDDDGSKLAIVSLRNVSDEFKFSHIALFEAGADMKSSILAFLNSEKVSKLPLGKVIEYFKEQIAPENKKHKYSGGAAVKSFQYGNLKFNFYFNVKVHLGGKLVERDICVLTGDTLYGIAFRNPQDKFDAREAMKAAIKNASATYRNGNASENLSEIEVQSITAAVLEAWATHFTTDKFKLGTLVMNSVPGDGIKFHSPGLGAYVKAG